MWLINTTSLALEFVEDPDVCMYAILSHTWGDGEVSFQDMADLERARTKQGFSKIERTCQLAYDHGLEYAWVDTCCIDKSSSAELTEAINSMFRWYKQSHICFVFLSDLLSVDEGLMSQYLPRCRWFTRGWTLQELIASEEIEFYGWGWNLIGTNVSLLGVLSAITGIEDKILNDSDMLQTVPVARRMSWAASRQTTRIEDLAYCLFGIFDVNLPLIYGEGQKAFIRLQEAIARENNDLSLFAWTSQNEDMIPFHRRRQFRGILAESPAEFKECSHLQNTSDPGVRPAQVSITNQGFNITDRLSDGVGDYLLNLDCNVTSLDPEQTIVIRLIRTSHGYVRHQSHQFTIVPHSSLQVSVAPPWPIPKTISLAEGHSIKWKLRHRFSLDVYFDRSDLLTYNIQRKPQHLWDHATKSFITDGYEAFTGIIEIDVLEKLRKTAPNSREETALTFSTSFIIIFGLEKETSATANFHLIKPWAGIYSLHNENEVSHRLYSVISQEKTRGFPLVSREARQIVLSQVDFLRGFGVTLFPTACEVAAKNNMILKFVLSTDLEENSDVTICKMRVDIELKGREGDHMVP
jgi:hypothetical protein